MFTVDIIRKAFQFHSSLAILLYHFVVHVICFHFQHFGSPSACADSHSTTQRNFDVSLSGHYLVSTSCCQLLSDDCRRNCGSLPAAGRIHSNVTFSGIKFGLWKATENSCREKKKKVVVDFLCCFVLFQWRRIRPISLVQYCPSCL